jgi:hypothetical protein
MVMTKIGYGLSGLLGAGIIFIGARFLVAPQVAAAGFGITTDHDGGTDPYWRSKRCVTSPPGWRYSFCSLPGSRAFWADT